MSSLNYGPLWRYRELKYHNYNEAQGLALDADYQQACLGSGVTAVKMVYENA